MGPAWHAVPVFGSFTKVRTRLGLRFVPSLARAAEAARTLMGALSPGAVHLLPSAVPASVSLRILCLFLGAGLYWRPSWWMSTIQYLRRSLVRNWRPVCSLVGVLSLGPSLPLSPPPCLLSLLGDGPVHCSSLELLNPFVLRTAGSVFGLVDFLSLSLSCCPTVCYLTLAPSNCPQGIPAQSLP